MERPREGLGPSLTLEEHGGVQARVVALKWSEEDSLKFCLGHRTDMKHLQNVIIWGNLEGLLGDALLEKPSKVIRTGILFFYF